MEDREDGRHGQCASRKRQLKYQIPPGENGCEGRGRDEVTGKRSWVFEQVRGEEVCRVDEAEGRREDANTAKITGEDTIPGRLAQGGLVFKINLFFKFSCKCIPC